MCTGANIIFGTDQAACQERLGRWLPGRSRERGDLGLLNTTSEYTYSRYERIECDDEETGLVLQCQNDEKYQQYLDGWRSVSLIALSWAQTFDTIVSVLFLILAIVGHCRSAGNCAMIFGVVGGYCDVIAILSHFGPLGELIKGINASRWSPWASLTAAIVGLVSNVCTVVVGALTLQGSKCDSPTISLILAVPTGAAALLCSLSTMVDNRTFWVPGANLYALLIMPFVLFCDDDGDGHRTTQHFCCPCLIGTQVLSESHGCRIAKEYRKFCAEV